jgi:hypothetical protein
MSHSVKPRRKPLHAGARRPQECDLRIRVKGERDVDRDEDIAGKDIRMAFTGMGLLILAALT